MLEHILNLLTALFDGLPVPRIVADLVFNFRLLLLLLLFLIILLGQLLIVVLGTEQRFVPLLQRDYLVLGQRGLLYDGRRIEHLAD